MEPIKQQAAIVRKIDGIGRIVIPRELRITTGIGNGDPLEFFVEDDSIILKLYRPVCILCGKIDIFQIINEKSLCLKCISKIKNMG